MKKSKGCAGGEGSNKDKGPLVVVIPPAACPPPCPPSPCKRVRCQGEEEKEKPVVIVQNTEVCDCESKWQMIDRWKSDAARRDEERRRKDEARDKITAYERYIRRIEANRRHKECIFSQRVAERKRLKEEEEWRRRRIEMEDRRLQQEYDMWLEDLVEQEEARAQEEAKQKREADEKWFQLQMSPRSKGKFAVPELEDLRSILAPIDRGPNEIFEYFAIEPKDPPVTPQISQISPGMSIEEQKRQLMETLRLSEAENENKRMSQELANAQMKAMMGLNKTDGIHINIGDREGKKGTLKINMGPAYCLPPQQLKSLGPVQGPQRQQQATFPQVAPAKPTIRIANNTNCIPCPPVGNNIIPPRQIILPQGKSWNIGKVLAPFYSNSMDPNYATYFNNSNNNRGGR